MASFSFGAGNAAKLARIPLYAAGRLATLAIPRGDRWVFGCGAGVADGALELWHEARRRGIEAVWLASSDEEERDARRRGMPVVRRGTWRGFWATARARVAVVTHGFGDVDPYAVTGAFVAQLWHGIPLKRIGLDAPEMVRSAFLPDSAWIRRIIATLYRLSAQRISLIPAASHLVRGRLESAFGIGDERVVVTGEPRVDVLSRGSAEERAARARRILRSAQPELDGAERIVLYAPTWRDGAADPAVPSREEWREIVAALERADVVLAIRSHRLGAGAYDPPFATDRVVDLGSDRIADIAPALPAFEALVTDYSSLVYDSALVPLPVLFLAPDAAEYALRRGFYGSYADIAGDDVPRTWSDLVPQLEAVLTDQDERARLVARAEQISASVHAFRDGRSADRVMRAILARTAPRVRSTRP